jgi:hypothetical protein
MAGICPRVTDLVVNTHQALGTGARVSEIDSQEVPDLVRRAIDASVRGAPARVASSRAKKAARKQLCHRAQLCLIYTLARIAWTRIFK